MTSPTEEQQEAVVTPRTSGGRYAHTEQPQEENLRVRRPLR